MKLLSILIFLSVLLFSCSEKEQENNKNYVMSLSKNFTLKLDSLAPPAPARVQYVENINTLICLNAKVNSLDFYLLDKKSNTQLSKRVFLQKEGTEAVGGINNFLYHNADSIFVLSSYGYKVSLVNSEGKLIDKYTLIKGAIGKETSMPMVFPVNNPMVLENRRYLYMSATPDRNPSTKSYYEVNNLSIRLDIQSKEYEYDMSYPDTYRKNWYPHSYGLFSRVYNPHKKYFVYSFFASDSLFTNTGERFYGGAEQIGKVKTWSQPILDDTENTLQGNQNSFYFDIHFNEYEKKYYRQGSLKSPEKGGKEKASVIIFDENLNKMGEAILTQEAQLNPYSIFFTPEGLWIQKITDNEDEIVYHLLEFKESNK